MARSYKRCVRELYVKDGTDYAFTKRSWSNKARTTTKLFIGNAIKADSLDGTVIPCTKASLGHTRRAHDEEYLRNVVFLKGQVGKQFAK